MPPASGRRFESGLNFSGLAIVQMEMFSLTIGGRRIRALPGVSRDDSMADPSRRTRQ